MRRPNNPANRLLGFAYNIVRLPANAVIRVLNFLLILSDTFIGRAVHHVFHFISWPIHIIHYVHHVFTPLELVFYPIRHVLHTFLWIPWTIFDCVLSGIEYLLKSRTTPFPKLPEIEFIYGH